MLCAQGFSVCVCDVYVYMNVREVIGREVISTLSSFLWVNVYIDVCAVKEEVSSEASKADGLLYIRETGICGDQNHPFSSPWGEPVMFCVNCGSSTKDLFPKCYRKEERFPKIKIGTNVTKNTN